MKPKNTICLWFDKDAQGGGASTPPTFPDSEVISIQRAPVTTRAARRADVLVVEFTVFGIPCIGLSGGPEFQA
jgi:predicted 3-demethylubiquinone-9 3-methyltransferase (glyoxalase superfamily)